MADGRGMPRPVLMRSEESMSRRLFALALLMAPAALHAQQPTPRDTLHQHGDSLTRRPITLEAVTVTSTPARREDPSGALRVSATILRLTPSFNAYDLLRQAAGLEVHDQGQGPGFAS